MSPPAEFPTPKLGKRNDSYRIRWFRRKKLEELDSQENIEYLQTLPFIKTLNIRAFINTASYYAQQRQT